jgi:succinate-acetate transporter protein
MPVQLGNPAPLGLLAFGMTTLMLMMVDMGWVEHDFEYVVAAYAIYYGGVGQMLVAIFELIQGSTFSFAVFFSYGAFWLGWAHIFVEKTKDYSSYQDAVYSTGMTLFFIQWGLLSVCFWIITWRKNLCLIVVFALLSATFFLLAAATSTKSLGVKKTAGYVGFLTAVGALYTGVAELINGEWGSHVLPGLRPMHTPERTVITKESIQKLTTYDPKTNSMFLQFSGLQIYRTEDIAAIYAAVEESILQHTKNQPKNKVHVVVDYKNVSIANELQEQYWNMTKKLERQYYLSVRRFAISSFGTQLASSNSYPNLGKFPAKSFNLSTDDLVSRNVANHETASSETASETAKTVPTKIET